MAATMPAINDRKSLNNTSFISRINHSWRGLIAVSGEADQAGHFSKLDNTLVADHISLFGSDLLPEIKELYIHLKCFLQPLKLL